MAAILDPEMPFRWIGDLEKFGTMVERNDLIARAMDDQEWGIEEPDGPLIGKWVADEGGDPGHNPKDGKEGGFENYSGWGLVKGSQMEGGPAANGAAVLDELIGTPPSRGDGPSVGGLCCGQNGSLRWFARASTIAGVIIGEN